MTSQARVNDYHAWSTVVAAQQEAVRFGDRRAGTDLLLLALLRDPVIEETLHVTLASARTQLAALDNAALADLGLPAIVDVATYDDEPVPARPSIRRVLQPRIRLTPAAKSAMEEAAKPMRRGMRISPLRLLLTLLDKKEPDPGAALLSALNVDRAQVRAQIRLQLKAEETDVD